MNVWLQFFLLPNSYVFVTATFKFIKSQDLSLLSIAKLNKANCSSLFSISNRILIRQISSSLNAFFWPTRLPLFQAVMINSRKDVELIAKTKEGIFVNTEY